jgi:aryl-alcohol dehydrogenase-like predicted oxidoreductase
MTCDQSLNGSSEEIVYQALKKYGRRDRICLSTKAGLAWDGGKPIRNAHPERLAQEVEDSLQRLQPDVIDIYFIHWADPAVPIEDTARAALIRAVSGSSQPDRAAGPGASR